MSHDAAPLLYSTLAEDPDVGELVGLFVEDLSERIRNLEQLLEASDREGVGRLAHQLKGAAGSYGFAPLTPLAAELESFARNGGSEAELYKAFEELQETCSRVRAESPQ